MYVGERWTGDFVPIENKYLNCIKVTLRGNWEADGRTNTHKHTHTHANTHTHTHTLTNS